jgi:lysine-specific demethylase 8
MTDVERTLLPDAAEDVRELARRLDQLDVPLVIAGGAATWPAVSRWDAGYLAARLGSIEITFKTSSSNAHPDFRASDLAHMFARGQASFAEFLEKIGTGPTSERARYLFTGDERFLIRRRAGQTSIDPDLAPLLEDVETPPLFPVDRLHTVWAWFSGPGVRTWLHYDNNGCHNLNAQITGRKRCVLYAPEELARLRPFALGGGNPAYNCSSIDVERPAAEAERDLDAATAWHAELAPGDLLFIPAWWFHTFEHLGEFNSNINFWWKPVRPLWNVVAARQALLDAVAAARVDPRAPASAAVLGSLDQAAVRRDTL